MRKSAVGRWPWVTLGLVLTAVTGFPWSLSRAQKPASNHPTQPAAGLSVEILGSQTCEKLGACQGASQHDGFVYLYGDASPGLEPRPSRIIF